METSGLDPEITICKIAVLPVKLCPPYYNIIYKKKIQYEKIIIFYFTASRIRIDTNRLEDERSTINL